MGFDTMIWQQLESELKKRIQDLEGTLDGGAPAKAEREAAVASAKAALETAQGSEESCRSACQQCRTELSEAKAALKVAKDAVSGFGPEMKQNQKAAAALNAEL